MIKDKFSFRLMKYRHRDLLTLLISLFIFSACENPTGVGLDVTPDEQIDALFTDTISLKAFTVKEDSAQSGSTNQLLFGLFNDPVFGKTVADLAIDLGRPEGFVQLKDDVEIDSVVLVLPFSNHYYGDTLASNFVLNVRQLGEAFAFNSFATKKWQVKDEVITSRTLGRYPYKRIDSLLLFQHVSGKDSLVKVAPQLRIRLDNEFFKDLLGSSVDSATLSTNAGFRNHVKGLHLSVDSTLSAGIGGLVGLSATAAAPGVEITYRQSNGKSGEDAGTDTIRTKFPISTYSPTGGAYLGMATSVQNHYVPSIQEQLNHEGEQFESIYLHSPTGLRGQILFPFIDELKGKGISINKAELVLYVDTDLMESSFNVPSPRLTLYREDIAGNRQNIPDGAALSSSGVPLDARSLSYLAFGGWYNQDHKRYIFHITSYLQDVLQGKINGNELFVAPVSVNDLYVPVNPAMNAGSRTIIGGPDHPTYKMKLNLYYTETVNN